MSIIQEIIIRYNNIPDFITPVIIPLLLFIWLLKSKPKTKISWLFHVILIGSYVLLTFLGANWFILSFYIRYIIVLLFIIAAVISALKLKAIPLWQKPKLSHYIRLSVFTVLIILISFCSFRFLSANSYEGDALHLAFPFKGGVYTVANGGNGEKSTIMNYHFSDPNFKRARVNDSMKYAVDIYKLNSFGTIRAGLFDYNLESYKDYAVFGETICSPCNGVVTDVYTSAKDISPGENLARGNTIVIKVDDENTEDRIYVAMLHLKQDSILVKIGDNVEAGQPVAQVGQSGTWSPHLHIHAAKNTPWGEGVPILFDNEFIVKNSLISK